MNAAELDQLNARIFPGATVEKKWSLPESMEHGPFFAMYLLLGAKVVPAPRAQRDYTSIIIDDHEYVLHQADFEFVLALAENFVIGYMGSKGIICDTQQELHARFRGSPTEVVKAIRFMRDDVQVRCDIEEQRCRIFWTVPDAGACGYYRASRPCQYMEECWQLDFFAQISSYLNYKALTYFQAVTYARVPNGQAMGILQNLKNENKLMIFETDDDLLNVPDWSYSHRFITKDVKKMYRTAVDLADIIFTTTERLKQQLGRPEITYITPNLIDMERHPKSESPQRPFQKQYDGFFPKRVPSLNGSEIKFFNKQGRELPAVHAGSMKDLNPIRILWAGSNTHDNDLQQIVKPIIMIGEEHGIAIRFYFMGYCPPDFARMEVEQGNTHPSIAILPEFRHFIQHVNPVSLADYPFMLAKIAPDIALCPLFKHEFNECKSNIKPLEMGTMRVPSIVTDYGPYEFIKHDYDGIKIPYSDDEATMTARWFNAIESLAKDRQKREFLGNNIYQRVLNEYSWQTDSTNRRLWDTFFLRVKDLIELKKQISKAQAAAVIDGQQQPPELKPT